jgi:predicted nucleic acid-binding protein
VTPVFLDTVGLIALWDNADQWHEAAQQAYFKLKSSAFVGLTTNMVLLECGNAAARRPYRSDVNQLRKELIANGELLTISEADWQQAWLAYDRGDAADAGIVDQLSFVIMRRLGLAQAFTNDRHFTAAGFETLF